MFRTKIFSVVLVVWFVVLTAQKSVFAAEPGEIDLRLSVLRSYLQSYNSPLSDYALYILDASDKSGLDWTLIPAISGVESNFGRKIPGGQNPIFTSFNAWGWGVYGDKVIYFNSWEEGIYKVAQGLKEEYIKRGLVTPYTMNFLYSSNQDWGWQVAYYQSELKDYASAVENQYGTKVQVYNQKVKDQKDAAQKYGPSGLFFSSVQLVPKGYGLSMQIQEY